MLKKHFLKVLSAVLTLALAWMAASVSFAEDAGETILNAGTTQAFTDEAVPEEDVKAILSAGLSAVSAINQQPWFLVAVTDKDVMSEISSAGGSFTPPAGSSADADTPETVPEGFSADSMPEGAPAMPASSGAKAALGDSPLAIIIYKNGATSSPDASFDCGLCAQNMYIAAASLGYGVKIVSSPTMSLNGSDHDALCEKLGVDPSLEAVAVLLIGKVDTAVDGATGASVRASLEEKTSIVK